ncbi:hypothetical protein AB0H43_10565 [Hamadaea sp. NPDC050747]|uniref:hypothetical protein n=1 Tax=Hamadaea sp. NPDC050747 TaxID=3155789 RepID=UPI0033F99E51
MARLTIEFLEPTWWATAVTVRIFYINPANGNADVVDAATGDVEWLPEGLSFTVPNSRPNTYVPWAKVSGIEQVA